MACGVGMAKAEWRRMIRVHRLNEELERDRRRWWFRKMVMPALWGVCTGGLPFEEPMYEISWDSRPGAAN